MNKWPISMLAAAAAAVDDGDDFYFQKIKCR